MDFFNPNDIHKQRLAQINQTFGISPLEKAIKVDNDSGMGNKLKDKLTKAKANKGGEHWITINGRHLLIGGQGEVKAGGKGMADGGDIESVGSKGINNSPSAGAGREESNSPTEGYSREGGSSDGDPVKDKKYKKGSSKSDKGGDNKIKSLDDHEFNNGEIRDTDNKKDSSKATSDIYPYSADEKGKAHYDEIASHLGDLANDFSDKLGIPKENIRISADNFYSSTHNSQNPQTKGIAGFALQIKPSKDKWKKAWAGNNLIMQSESNGGIVIRTDIYSSHEKPRIEIEKDKIPSYKENEVKDYKSHNKELHELESSLEDNKEEITKLIFSKLKEMEKYHTDDMGKIAPNTPIIYTGK